MNLIGKKKILDENHMCSASIVLPLQLVVVSIENCCSFVKDYFLVYIFDCDHKKYILQEKGQTS